nr:MAG TPA: hypothetical protein [Caudoviricetes sp.]
MIYTNHLRRVVHTVLHMVQVPRERSIFITHYRQVLEVMTSTCPYFFFI